MAIIDYEQNSTHTNNCIDDAAGPITWTEQQFVCGRELYNVAERCCAWSSHTGSDAVVHAANGSLCPCTVP